MRNTLQPGDHILVDRIGYHLHAPRRGDVVVVDAADLLLPGPVHAYIVKRVIGVAGDRVRCCDPRGHLTINGESLDERYLFPGDRASEVTFDVRVPPGRLWLLGDHRAVSEDSRALLGRPGGGLIPRDRVVGRAFAVVWPPSRWQGVG